MTTKTMVASGAGVVALILLLRLDPAVLALLLGMGLGVALCVGAVVLVRFCADDKPVSEPIPTLAAERAECERKQAARQAAWEANHAD